MRVMEYYVPAIFNFPPPKDVTAEKIRSFADLPAGWHFGVGRPSDIAETQRALAILDDLRSLGFTTTNAFPGQDGEIAVTVDALDNDIEIIVEVGELYTLVRDKNLIELERFERISLTDLKGLLAKISGEIWNSSVYYTQNIMMPQKIDSKALHSEILRAEAYPSFQWSVLKKAERISVRTVGDTIAA